MGYVNRLLAPGTHQIGDYAEGGVIFWLTQDRKHGLVAAIEDQTGEPSSSGAADNLVAWSSDTTTFVGAQADGVFVEAGGRTAGKINTDLILSALANKPAAQLCADYSVIVNGVTYDDWYLPSLQELGLMMAERATINATATAHGGGAFWKSGDANTPRYWSSYEFFTANAGALLFSGSNGTFTVVKTSPQRVRAIRAF